MTELMTFDFEEQAVRSLLIDEQPWFVGRDVCRCLGLEQASRAMSRLESDERKEGVTISTPLGGPQKAVAISEPGVYRLVFTSRTDAAKRFKRWLAHDVLPAIRRTGVYIDPERIVHEHGPKHDMLVDEMNAASRAIKECRTIYGREAAQRLWEKLGMPDVSEFGVSQRAGTAADDPVGCLRHLMNTGAGEGQTVGGLIGFAWSDMITRGRLAAYGIAVRPGKAGGGTVAIADEWSFLDRVFETTQWSGNWNAALIGLTGAARAKNPVDFDGRRRRAVVLPKSAVNRQG